MELAIILSTGFSLLLIMSLTVTQGPNFVQAQGTDPYSFPVSSSPYGIPFKDWTAKWAAWLDSLPKASKLEFSECTRF